MHCEPLTGTIGAEVSGIDLAAIDTLPKDDLDAAFVAHKVLVFRDQQLDDRGQRAFAAIFGTPQVFPFGPSVDPDLPEVHAIATGGPGPKVANADIWHSDATFMTSPPLGTVLRAVRLPGGGGDTLFTDTTAAYDALSAPVRRLVDELTASHDVARSSAHRKSLHDRFPPVTHPVVRVHPVTGRRALFVNRTFTSGLLGLSAREEEALLPLLCDHVQSPDFQCRVRWAPGTLVMWDNRSTQHYAVHDYHEPRVMHRVLIDGDVPRGVEPRTDG